MNVPVMGTKMTRQGLDGFVFNNGGCRDIFYRPFVLPYKKIFLKIKNGFEGTLSTHVPAVILACPWQYARTLLG